MSLLGMIKAEKKLSFKHWRYRLLHWTFGEDPSCPEESGLPRFLYTHYCPLFHLTNILVVVAPIILFCKLAMIAFNVVAALVMWVFDLFEKAGKIVGPPIAALAKKCWPERKERDTLVTKSEPEIERNSPALIAQAKKSISRWLINRTSNDMATGYEWWKDNINHFRIWKNVDESILKEIHAHYLELVTEARRVAQEKKERRRQRIIFWVNWSRFIIKWTLNVGYTAAAAAVLWVVWNFGIPVAAWTIGGIADLAVMAYNGVTSVTFVDSLLFCLNLFARAVVFILAVLALGFVTWKSGVLGVLGNGAATVCRGFSPITNGISTFFSWCGRTIESVGEFFSMFYEENCPPVTIISDDEQEIADLANEGD